MEIKESCPDYALIWQSLTRIHEILVKSMSDLMKICRKLSRIRIILMKIEENICNSRLKKIIEPDKNLQKVIQNSRELQGKVVQTKKNGRNIRND
jgi:hypothetical protein